MICKFTLKIDNVEHELGSDCIRNWDDIKCTIERKEYGGVTRSFSTKIEFTNNAYDLLYKLYLQKGIYAEAYIAIYVINNRWKFEKIFDNRLDFSTLTDDGRVLSLNSIDNSLAAIIKSNKSTKYELLVGEEIPVVGKFNFDRLAISETVSFQVIGATNEYSSDMIYSYDKSHGDRVVCNYLSDDIEVGGAIEYHDEDTESNSYILKAIKDVTVTGDYIFSTSKLYGHAAGSITINKISGGSTTTVKSLHNIGVVEAEYYKGWWSTIEDLKYNYPVPEGQDWALIGRDENTATVWIAGYTGYSFYWQDTGLDKRTYETRTTKGTFSFNLKAGDLIYVAINITSYPSNTAVIKIFENKINFYWDTKGQNIDIDVIKPIDVASSILNKMCKGVVNVDVEISDYDERLSNTYITVAESIRGISNAKLYSSFDDFCSWMETVFGYVYYIGTRKEPMFNGILEVGHYEYTPREYEFSALKEFSPEDIYYIIGLNKFLARDADGVYYENWIGSAAYYDSVTTGLPKTGVIFKMNGKSTGSEYVYFDDNGIMYDFTGDVSQLYLDIQSIHFAHRSEIFSNDNIVKIDNAIDFSYSIESSLIYSKLTIGYEMQEYDSRNGRDEWNFSNEYSSGADATDKALELKSKYRADCYGFEFLAQKRASTTTDSEGDKDVFFVLLKQSNSTLILNRGVVIENTRSRSVFNGEYSVPNCVKANMGYLGAMKEGITLLFASSEGNSDVTINGEKMSSDIVLTNSLFTAGELTFSTDDINIPTDWNCLIKVEQYDRTYTGYIKKAEMKFGKQSGIEYTLIVKHIEQ